MAVRCEDYNDVCVLCVDGELTTENAGLLRKTVDECIEQKRIVDFVIDLLKTDFIDSEGLETLLWTKRRCEEHFGQVKLAALDANCRKILEITRLEHAFECRDDVAAALKMMR